MRAVLQRVSQAEVQVAGTKTKTIGQGLLVFLGVMEGDQPQQAAYLVKKICDMRIFTDTAQKLNLSLKDIHGDILIVSNFTLAADCRHGRRPSFEKAARPQAAEALYEHFVSLMQQEPNLGQIQTGVFGAHMHINAQNDGPITMIMDTDNIAKH